MEPPSLPPDTARFWAARIRQTGRLEAGARVLLAGSDSLPIAEALARAGRYHVAVAVPPGSASPAAPQGVESLPASASLSGLRSQSLDCLFLSDPWDAVPDLQAAAASWFRALAPAGSCLVRHLSPGQMEHVLEYRFFPRALALALALTPDLETLMDTLRRAGFTRVRTHHLEHHIAASAQERLRRIASRHSTVLAELTEQEFQEGLTALEEHLLHETDESEALTEPQALTVARRPRA